MNKRLWVGVVAVCMILTPISAPRAYAQYRSSNFQVLENSMNAGGDTENSSANYKARSTLGETGVGRNSSANYFANSGFNTTDEDYLQFTVSNSTVSLGNLTTSSTGTGTATFSVRAYLSSGYVVKTMSNPPTNESGVSLAAMTSGGASSQGTEQFGINLKANTSPTTFGANRVHVPDDSFAWGEPATGYDTQNSYKYNAGDTIATASIGEGETDFTISYIANMSILTKAGTYTMIHDLVVIPTY